MNTNLIHNILNLVMLIVAALAQFDWTSLGISSGIAVKIVGALALAKLVINVSRDGVSGLAAPQPPVQK